MSEEHFDKIERKLADLRTGITLIGLLLICCFLILIDISCQRRP